MDDTATLLAADWLFLISLAVFVIARLGKNLNRMPSPGGSEPAARPDIKTRPEPGVEEGAEEEAERAVPMSQLHRLTFGEHAVDFALWGDEIDGLAPDSLELAIDAAWDTVPLVPLVPLEPTAPTGPTGTPASSAVSNNQHGSSRA